LLIRQQIIKALLRGRYLRVVGAPDCFTLSWGERWLACARAYAHTGYAQFSKCVCTNEPIMSALAPHIVRFLPHIFHAALSARHGQRRSTAATNHLLFASTRIIGIVCLHRRPALSQPIEIPSPSLSPPAPILRSLLPPTFCLIFLPAAAQRNALMHCKQTPRSSDRDKT
jgi:hypothetical protein